MENSKRTASDVLLGLEAKMDQLVKLINNQDFNMKILSNKITDMAAQLEKQPVKTATVEAVQIPNKLTAAKLAGSPQQIYQDDEDRQIPIVADHMGQMDQAPTGFRRNSRPETYAPNNKSVSPPTQPQTQVNPKLTPENKPVPHYEGRQYIKKPVEKIPEVPMPIQVPKAGTSKMTIEPASIANKQPEKQVEKKAESNTSENSSQVPVIQRCVDKNGKSIFLATVKIYDLNTNEEVYSTRTNGTGKLNAVLPFGDFRMIISKRDNDKTTGEIQSLEAIQDIHIDASTQSPLNLPMIIIK